MLQIAVSQPGQRVLLTLVLLCLSARHSATAAGTAHGFAPRAIQIQGAPAQYSIKHGQEVGHRAPVEILHGHGAARANKKQTIFSPPVRLADRSPPFYSSMWTNFPRAGWRIAGAGRTGNSRYSRLIVCSHCCWFLELRSNRQGMREHSASASCKAPAGSWSFADGLPGWAWFAFDVSWHSLGS